MHRLALMALMALGIAGPLPARASILLDSGVVDDRYYSFSFNPTADRFRLTFISDRSIYVATIVRLFGYHHWQWFDYRDEHHPNAFGWYRDNLYQIQADCGYISGGPELCEDFLWWDSRKLLSISPVDTKSFVAHAVNALPLETEPQIGHDYQTWVGPMLTEILVGWETRGVTNYRLYLTEVPEPATWALLIAGFGLTGAALRRRRVLNA